MLAAVLVALGSTHALIMDAGVVECVLECMCEDFKHFKELSANHPSDSHTGKGPNSKSNPNSAGQVSRSSTLYTIGAAPFL